jgi:hypothetical protein
MRDGIVHYKFRGVKFHTYTPHYFESIICADQSQNHTAEERASYLDEFYAMQKSQPMSVNSTDNQYLRS